MEIDDPYLTLLTPDGEFLRAHKSDRLYSVGEEIDFFPVTDNIVSKKSKSIRTFFTLRTALMSAAVLIICLGSIIPVYQSNKAYAYMSIDASTSIEMGLNKQMEVVHLKGFDKEADEIISQLGEWEKKDVSVLTAIIVAELKDEGQISQSEPVVISTVKTKQLNDNVETKLEKNVVEIQQTIDQQLVEVKVYTITEEEIEKARDSGVPVGIYQRSKNKSAKNKQPREKNNNMAPIESSAKSTLPPGQQKKQKNNSNLPDNRQSEYLNEKKNDENKKPVVINQENGNQVSPGVNIGKNNGNEKRNNSQVKQRENNKVKNQEKQNSLNQSNNREKQNINNNKQEKQKTNNHNNVRKHENKGKK
ncbi:anti-sigma factor domain-containing protein [Neobacillus niacini]|uniref:anti-sigma factor domain-containing protein n=1 Tax=Neobacillus niacini TaxID=86668 RepID=UPI001C8D207E|nr:anti-sigma factor domain-containing protein [Neobacillus niacini]MBY0144705.1 anti-sigma factor domain-containing protein [Neobacillus niacini]